MHRKAIYLQLTVFEQLVCIKIKVTSHKYVFQILGLVESIYHSELEINLFKNYFAHSYLRNLETTARFMKYFLDLLTQNLKS